MFFMGIINFKLVREAIQKSGLSETEWAKRYGFSQRAVNSWVKEERAPRFKNILKLAQALDCSVSDICPNLPCEEFREAVITTGDHSMLQAAYENKTYPKEFLDQISQDLVRRINAPTPPAPDLEPYKEVKTPSGEGLFVPIISSAAAATCNPGLMPLLDCVEQHSEEKTWFRQAKEGDFVIEVIGDSMNPWYPEGTLLLVRPYQPLRNGQRVVAVLDSGEIIFKVYAEKDDKVCLFSISNDGKDFIFTKPMVPLRYICRVIASQRSEDDLDAEMHNVNMVHGWQLKLKEI